MKNKHTIRLFAIFLCLLLITPLSSIRAYEQIDYNASDFKYLTQAQVNAVNVYTSNFICVNGYVYILDTYHLIKYDPATNKYEYLGALPHKSKEDNFYNYTLFEDKGELIVKQNSPLAFYRLDTSSKNIKLRLAYSFVRLNDIAPNSYLNNMAITDNHVNGLSYNDKGKYEIISIDKLTANVARFALNDIDPHQVIAYKDNTLALLSYDYQQAINTLSIFDGKNLKSIDIPYFSNRLNNMLHGMVYNKYTQKLIFFDSNFAYEYDQTNNKLVELVYFKGLAPRDIGIINKDTLAFAQHQQEGIQTAKLDPSAVPKEFISIYGFDDINYYKYNLTNPKYPIINKGIDLRDSDLNMLDTDYIINLRNSCDLIELENTDGLNQLVEDKIIAPITSSQIISSNVAQMYPYIKNAIIFNGDIYYYPLQIYAYNAPYSILNFAYNKQAFKTLGISQNKIPKNYDEFIDFTNYWQNELKPKHKEYTFMQGSSFYNIKRDLLLRILNTNILNYVKQNQKPVFNNMDIENTLNKLSKINTDGFSNIDESIVYENDDDKEAMIKVCEDILDLPEGYEILPLKISNSLPNINTATMQVIALNDSSNKKEKAVGVIEFLAGNALSRTKAILFKTAHDPAIKESSQKIIQKNQALAKAIQKEIGNAADGVDDKRQQLVEALLKENNNIKAYNYTIASMDEIEAYRQSTNTFIINSSKPLKFDSSKVNNIIYSYLTNKSDTSSLLKALDECVE